MIQSAFSITPSPIGQLTSAPDIDNDDAELELAFRGANWQTLHPDFLARYYGAISTLNEPAFRYFFPAFLIVELIGTDLDENYHTEANLFNELTNPYRNANKFFERWRNNRYRRFSRQQKDCIIAYLSYCMGGNFDKVTEYEIKNYWMK